MAPGGRACMPGLTGGCAARAGEPPPTPIPASQPRGGTVGGADAAGGTTVALQLVAGCETARRPGGGGRRADGADHVVTMSKDWEPARVIPCARKRRCYFR